MIKEKPYEIEISTEENQLFKFKLTFQRIHEVLKVTKEPASHEMIFRKTEKIPIASLYRLLNLMVSLGWLRVFTNVNGRGKSVKMWVSTGNLIPYPNLCGDCNMTLYSYENEIRHREKYHVRTA